MAYSGKFTPKHPQKYRGDPTNIVYRSLWERNVMVKLDNWAEVTDWASEELAIPYRSPIDNAVHRYFPDFVVRMKDGRVMILEVKPKAQVKVPKKPKNKNKKAQRRYIGESMEYGKNQAKWEAARVYCDARGWKFHVLTEDDIFTKPAK